MPILIPTASELADMSWHSRRRISARVRAAIDHAAEVEARRQSPLARALAALPVIEQARILLAEMPPDPDADAHWLALEEATR